jgi:PncC family amidohydrolase
MELASLSARLQDLALERGLTVGTAESCTGGLIGHALTAIPGSSRYYRGGVVSYSDDIKIRLLDVPATAIERHGAVSAQVAVAMAEGARQRLECDYAVSVTGVAGPDGGSEAKPVGLTYVAAAGPVDHEVQRHLWDGDRAANKEHSAVAAVELLVALIERGQR